MKPGLRTSGSLNILFADPAISGVPSFTLLTRRTIKVSVTLSGDFAHCQTSDKVQMVLAVSIDI